MHGHFFLQLTILYAAKAWIRLTYSNHSIWHDRVLMETFSESNISNFKVFHLNCCRIFPQIATVADIDTADWLRLRPEIFKCKKLKDRKSTLLWPNQPDLQTSKKQTGNQL